MQYIHIEYKIWVFCPFAVNFSCSRKSTCFTGNVELFDSLIVSYINVYPKEYG